MFALRTSAAIMFSKPLSISHFQPPLPLPVLPSANRPFISHANTRGGPLSVYQISLCLPATSNNILIIKLRRFITATPSTFHSEAHNPEMCIQGCLLNHIFRPAA